MKKLTTILAVVLVIACLMSVSAFADGSLTVSADKSAAERGDTVTVSVSLTNPGLVVLQFNVLFDTDVFELVSKNDGGTLPVISAVNDTTAGKAGFYQGNDLATSNLTANGVVGTVVLKVKDAAPGGNSTISTEIVNAYDYNVDNVTVTTGSATVRIDVPCEHTNLTPHEAVPSTCTVQGTEAYWECDDCGKLFSDAEAKKEIQEPVKAALADHTMPEGGATTVAATCNTAGKTSYVCTVCHEEIVTAEEKALGHDYGDWTVVTKPTYTAVGEETHTCQRSTCTDETEGHVESREIAKLTVDEVTTGSTSPVTLTNNADENVNGVKIGDTVLTPDQFTIVGDKITISGDVIKGLAAGTYKIELTVEGDTVDTASLKVSAPSSSNTGKTTNNGKKTSSQTGDMLIWFVLAAVVFCGAFVVISIRKKTSKN